jgi:hypothetical protein
LKALSIRQPWAWAILHAGKDVENRDWNPRHGYGRRDLGFRGEFLIHACMRPNPTRVQREASEFFAFCEAHCIGLPDGATAGELFLHCGGIVGSARVIDIRPNGVEPESPWAIDGQVGLVLDDVRPLPFAPCKGALGFWEVPASVMAAIEKARAA